MAAARSSRTGVPLIAAGLVAIAVLFLVYGRYQDPVLLTPDAIDDLQRMADGFYIGMTVSLGAVSYGMYRYHRQKALAGGSDRLSIIAALTWNTKSRRIFAVVFAMYGLFFALMSGSIVYQESLSFSYHYGVAVPSIEIAPCCDLPGYMPKILAYMTDHIGLQIIPINLVLQVTVSYLVGLNAAVAARAYTLSRGRRGLGGSLGAATGLFIACPTCAGSAISVFAGAASGILVTAALVQIQTILIALTIPVLLLTPFILVYSLQKSSGGCAMQEV